MSGINMEEALFIGLIVGGTITIPNQRRAIEAWDELKKKRDVNHFANGLTNSHRSDYTLN